MRILAVGDIHADRYREALEARLGHAGAVDLVLLAGDITERNDVEAFGEVLATLERHTDAPIVAIFGNEEWADSHEAYRKAFPITFLHDEAIRLEANPTPLYVVGSTGSLDTPTWWQRTHLPHIVEEYAERVRHLDALLDAEEYRILLTHYAPTTRTLVGEGEGWWEQLASRSLEAVVLRRRPELVIHAHAHKGIPYAALTTAQATLTDFTKHRAIPVYNVAFPVRDDVTILEVPTPEEPLSDPLQ